MKKFILFILLFVFLGMLFPGQTLAQTITQSPKTFTVTLNTVGADKRAKILHDYLASYNSPLADKSDVFIQDADKYNLDWRLVPAIAGVESYYGTQIPNNSYNGWGYDVYGNNVRYFTSWNDGIDTVSKALREQYINQNGAKNIYQIGNAYAADPEWANKVQHFMDDISAYQQTRDLNTLSLSI